MRERSYEFELIQSTGHRADCGVLHYLLIAFFALIVILPVAGCDSSDSGDDGQGEMDGGGEIGDDGDMGGGDDMGGGGQDEGDPIIIEPGGTLADEPVTFSYVEGGTPRQTLDYYEMTGLESQSASVNPRGAESARPVLVWFHGGGWVINDKTNIEPIAFEIAEAGGFHFISVGYRLAGQGQDPWPGMIQEVKSAVRWIKQNSEALGIDPDFIIVTGESAGAHLAAMLATSAGVAQLEGSVNPGTPSDVAGGVLFYGPYDFGTIIDQGLELILDGTCSVDTLNPLPVWFLLDCPISDNPFDLDPLAGCDQDDLVEASPVTHVGPDDPPLFIASGTEDCFVPWMQALDLQNFLLGADVPNEVSITIGGEHDADTLDVTVGQIISFIEQNVTR